MPVLSALLALALAAPPAAVAAPERAQLTVNGRAVEVPSGCESTPYPGGGRIACGQKDWVAWGRTDDAEAAEARTALGAVLRGPVLQPGWNSTESEVPCRVAGADATCTRVLGESRRERVLILWATSHGADGAVLASCMSPAATLGRACALVFELAAAR
jgi:hypothetical protein